MYDMVNIFEVFLPQLLRYPNPTDPLNGEAAALLMKDPKAYDVKVKGKNDKTTHNRREDTIINRTSVLTIVLQSTLPNTPQKNRSTKLGSSRTTATR
jgi:hypothetical protein